MLPDGSDPSVSNVNTAPSRVPGGRDEVPPPPPQTIVPRDETDSSQPRRDPVQSIDIANLAGLAVLAYGAFHASWIIAAAGAGILVARAKGTGAPAAPDPGARRTIDVAKNTAGGDSPYVIPGMERGSRLIL